MFKTAALHPIMKRFLNKIYKIKMRLFKDAFLLFFNNISYPYSFFYHKEADNTFNNIK